MKFFPKEEHKIHLLSLKDEIPYKEGHLLTQVLLYSFKFKFFKSLLEQLE